MELRVLDEVIAPAGAGVVLLCMEEESARLLHCGMHLRDALGEMHLLGDVTCQQEGLYTLYIPDGDPAYFQRLFRKVTVDATCFRFDPKEDAPCQ